MNPIGNNNRPRHDVSIAENVARNVTMSSREIAELTGKRHDNVKRTIESLVAARVIESPQIEEIPTATKPVAVYVFSGEKGKRDSIVVVAQLSPEFTAALVDRWQELEAKQQAPRVPQTLPEALRLAADLAEQNIGLRQVVAQQAPTVAAHELLTDAAGSLCLTDAAKHLNVPRKSLLTWLQANRWIYRRAGAAHWLAYQPRMATGYLLHKVTVIGEDEQGDSRLASQVRVTPKGLSVLARQMMMGA